MGVENPTKHHVGGRRMRSRLATQLPATLVTLFGSLPAFLLDISLTGARCLVTNNRGITNPLRSGKEVVLEWSQFDAFGTIIWEGEGICGILFDPIISPSVLVATRDIHDAFVQQGGLKHMEASSVRDWVEGKARY